MTLYTYWLGQKQTKNKIAPIPFQTEPDLQEHNVKLSESSEMKCQLKPYNNDSNGAT